ncbi:Hypothetical predicted protein [Cloeon dipterum]|uniref:Uncharacterized protein n=1 Tax=Cloeon dipterum TaxID=197152 RepID=A0A8S1BY31_9INSE|nr:Hypothetical predicted protein [Cloeon dipterum]
MERAVTRVKQDLGKSAFVEFKGPGGCWLCLSVVTNNVNSLKSQLKGVYRKCLFSKSRPVGPNPCSNLRGFVVANPKSGPPSVEASLEHAIEAGAEDVIFREEDRLLEVQALLVQFKYDVIESSNRFIPHSKTSKAGRKIIMADSSRPLASVPWVYIFNNNPDLKLEDSAVFENVQFRSKAEKDQKLSIFKNLNKLFPFYIPMEHHRMNVKGMVKNSPNGQYWAVALYFLLSSNGHNQYAWNEFQEHLDAHSEGKNVNNSTCAAPYISDFTMDTLFPGGNPPQCQRVEEYINDPWVLMQLQFQPALFHQWLVAFMVEIYKMSMELSELHHLPSCLHGKDKNVIIGIFEWNKSAWKYVSQGFSFLQAWAEFNYQDMRNMFPGIDFPYQFMKIYIDHDVLNVIRSYKKLAWGNSHVALNKLEDVKYQVPRNIYDLSFWKKTTLERLTMFESAEYDFEAGSLEEGKDKTVFGIDELLESLQPFCNHKLEFSQKLKNFLSQDDEFLTVVSQLKREVDITALLRIRKEENGIIGTALSISQYHKMNDFANCAKGRLYKLTKIDPSKLLRVNYDDLSLLKKLNIEDFKENPPVIKSRFLDDNTIIEPMLKFEIDAVDKKCPCFTEDPATIADKFEARIKNIVRERVKLHSKNILNEFRAIDTNPGINDWKFAQYLLPCFVASMLELLTNDKETAISRKMTEWYIAIINMLICSYEVRKQDYKMNDNEVDEEHLAYFVKSWFSSPILLKSFFKSTIDNLRFIFSKDKSFQTHFDQVLHSFESLFEVLINSCEFSPSSKLPSRTDYCFEMQTFDFFILLERVIYSHYPKNLNRKPDPDNMAIVRSDLIKVLCEIGFHEENIFKDIPLGLETSSILLLALIKYCLQKNDDLTRVKRLKKPDKSLDALMNDAKEECGNLTAPQKQCLAFYLAVKMIPRKNFSMLLDKNLTNSILDHMLHSFAKGGNMLSLVYFMNNGVPHEESRVSHEFAKEKAPVLYYVAMNELNKSSTHYKEVLKKASWFFPIVHCRNCGVVDKDVYQYPCSECSNNEHYPDNNFFCSEQCKNIAMNTFHAKEHADFVGMSTL